MSRYYPQQSSSFYPPQQNPEDDDYYDDEDDFEYEVEDDEDEDDSDSGDSLSRRALIFVAGGCLVLLCIGCCVLLGAGLWYLDPGSGLLAPTPIPGSDLGLSFDDPAFPDETVVNDQNVELSLLDVNRNASLLDVPIVEGREIIIVTVELVNMGEEDINYSERNFLLLNRNEEGYTTTPGVIDGALNRGTLPPGEGLEGRLVFEVIAGEPELTLAWESEGSETRFVLLE
jgi:hypothetical protein